MTPALHETASRVRHSRLIRPVEPVFRWLEPIWNATMDAIVYRDGFPATINGEPLRLTYSYGSRYSKLHRYEPDISLPFAEAIHPGMTVLDVGAHVGILAMIAARRAGPEGRVVAFEPSPATVRLLERHVGVNGLGGLVSVMPAVVTDRAGTMTFYCYGASMAASLSRENVEVLNRQHPAHATAVEVPAITLDGYCTEHGLRPNVIKIDVEGAEFRVLSGARGILDRQRPTIFCEIHPRQLSNVGDSEDALRKLVASVDYRIEALAPPGHMGIYPARLSPA